MPPCPLDRIICANEFPVNQGKRTARTQREDITAPHPIVRDAALQELLEPRFVKGAYVIGGPKARDGTVTTYEKAREVKEIIE